MKRNRILAAAAAVAAAVSFAGPAAAEWSWSDVYVGAAIGQSKYRDGCTDSGCDDKDTAYKLFAGYQFNDYLGAEIAWNDFGNPSWDRGRLEGHAFEMVGVARYPITDRFSAYGKLGAYNGKLETATGEERKTHATYGVGAQYDLTRNMGLRAEWQRYDKMGGGRVVETDVDTWNVGLVYRFK